MGPHRLFVCFIVSFDKFNSEEQVTHNFPFHIDVVWTLIPANATLNCGSIKDLKKHTHTHVVPLQQGG